MTDSSEGKARLPWVVLRVDPDKLSLGGVERVCVVLSLFDEKEHAESEAARLQELNGGKNIFYFVQRIKKYCPAGS